MDDSVFLLVHLLKPKPTSFSSIKKTVSSFFLKQSNTTLSI